MSTSRFARWETRCGHRPNHWIKGMSQAFHGRNLYMNGSLVGGLEHEWIIFPYIGNVIIPTDSYFSEGLNPPTSSV